METQLDTSEKRRHPMKVGVALQRVVERACSEDRLVVGVIEVATFLQSCRPPGTLCCIIRDGDNDRMIDAQLKLIEAFCREHSVRLLKVNTVLQFLEEDSISPNIKCNRCEHKSDTSHIRNIAGERDVICTEMAGGTNVSNIAVAKDGDDVSERVVRCTNIEHAMCHGTSREHAERHVTCQDGVRGWGRKQSTLITRDTNCLLVKYPVDLSTNDDFVLSFHDLYQCSDGSFPRVNLLPTK